MVQKYKSPIRTYKYPFELVMAAYERRFPTCDMIPVLVSTDIIKEDKSDDGSTHIIERRCKLNVDAPYLLKKVAGVEYFFCIQRNTLDRRARTLQIEAWNESFAKKIVINEFCRYFVHPDNDDWTCFEQTASLEVKSFFSFESAVEKLAVKLYAQSIEKGKEIIEMHVTQLKSEGINFVAPFGVSENTVNGACKSSVDESSTDDVTSNINDNKSVMSGEQISDNNVDGDDICEKRDDTCSETCISKSHLNSRQNSAKHKHHHNSSIYKHKLNNRSSECTVDDSSDLRCEKCFKSNSKLSSPSPCSLIDKRTTDANDTCTHTIVSPPSSCNMVATSSSSLESTITTSSFASSTITVANSSGTEDSASLNNGSSDECVINSSTTMVTSSSEYYSS